MLFRANLVLFVFHTTSALLMSFLHKADMLPEIPVVDYHVRREDQAVTFEVLFTAQIRWMSVAFISLAALDHLLCCINLPRMLCCKLRIRDYYNKCIASGNNPIQWIEYSISASIMNVQIAMLSGIVVWGDLAAIFVGTAAVMTFGLYGERINSWRRVDYSSVTNDDERREVDWWPFTISTALYMLVWGRIGVAFFSALSRTDRDVPFYVQFIFFGLLTVESLFAVVYVLEQTNSCGIKKYTAAALSYQALSLTAKTALAWATYFGS